MFAASARRAAVADRYAANSLAVEWRSVAELEPIADAPAFIDAWACAHRGEPRAATVGLYDHEQWPDGPFACDFVFVTQDLHARIASCDVDPHSRSSDHQPMWLELR